jgi:hypothetical protein
LEAATRFLALALFVCAQIQAQPAYFPLHIGDRWQYSYPLIVFNSLGERVAALVDESQEAGYHDVRFDGSRLASGVYFCRLISWGYAQTRTLVILL